MNFRKAEINDISQLVKMRLGYLFENEKTQPAIDLVNRICILIIKLIL